MAEGAFRSLKIGIAISDTPNPYRPLRQLAIAHAVISKNRFPHSIAWHPTACEMTGRCDILPGFPPTSFNREPEAIDVVARKTNEMSRITNGRDAIIHSDANLAVRTCLGRQLAGEIYIRCHLQEALFQSVRITYGREPSASRLIRAAISPWDEPGVREGEGRQDLAKFCGDDLQVCRPMAASML